MNINYFRDYTEYPTCKIVPKIKNFEKFFNKIVNKIKFLENECWEWRGYSYSKKNNYLIPSITIQNKIYPIYRVLYHFLIEPLKEKDYLLRKCEKKFCINPFHREITDNYNDIGRFGGKLQKNRRISCKNNHVYDENVPTFRYKIYKTRRYRSCLICYKINKGILS